MRFFIGVILLIWPLMGATEESPLEDSITPPTPIPSVAGIPSSFVGGQVNVIAGDFCLTETDLVADGPEPLAHQRFYSSARSRVGLAQEVGWSYSYQNYLQLSEKPENNIRSIHANVREPSGASLPYHIKKHKNARGPLSVPLHPQVVKNGLTNCHAGEISGRTQLKNARILIAAGKPLTMELGSGSRRTYNRRNADLHWLSHEQKTNSRRVNYSYGTTATVNGLQINATDGNQTTVLGSLSYAESPITRTGCTQIVTAHNGGSATLSFHNEIFASRLGYRSALQPTLVVSSHAPTVAYTYHPADSDFAPRLRTRDLPEGRSLRVEYYTPGINLVADQSIRVDSDHYSYGKVKRLLAPVGNSAQLLETYTFLYEPDWLFTKNSKGKRKAVSNGGRTTVLDTLKNKTVYHYSEDQRLYHIDYFDAHGHIDHVQRYVWGLPDTPLAGNLLRSSLEDHNGNVVASRSYRYDDRGNILQDTLEASITGEGLNSYIKLYQYSNDGFNLVLREEDNAGKSVSYEYQPGTDLVVAKLSSYNNQILKREFYTYDKNGVMVRSVEDDGSTSTRDDLTGVTERHITAVQPRTSVPALGLPEVIDRRVLDLNSGTEVLLSRRIREYTAQGQVKAEDLYDANGQFAGRTEFVYDSMGNLTMSKNALGHVVRWTYDANGNKVSESGPRANEVRTYKYDYSNRLREEQWSDGRETFAKKYSYDLCSRRVSSRDICGQETIYEYDVFGRCVKTTFPQIPDENGVLVSPVTYKTYDVLGHATSETDANGYTTRTIHNIHGKPVEVFYPDQTRESYRYTIDGLLWRFTSKTGAVTEYTYDGLGRVVKEEVSYQGQILKTTTRAYNGFRLLTTTDGEGNRTVFSYDAAGRLVRVKVGSQVTVYEYDSLGREHKVVRGAGTAEAVAEVKEYDLLGNTIEERTEDACGTIQRLMRYTYDEVGNRTQTSGYNQRGENTSFTEYDVNNQPVKVVDALGHCTVFWYNYQFQNENGQSVLQITKTDALGRQVIDMKNAQGSTVSIRTKDAFGVTTSLRRHCYDGAGNRIRTIETIYVDGADPGEITYQWEYGPGARLEKVIEALGHPNQRTVSYRYDARGQRKAVIKPDGIALEYRYDGIGQISEFFASDGSFHYCYAYDRNENIIEIYDKVSETSTRRMYDPAQQLVEEIQAHGLTMRYDYDAVLRASRVVLPDGTAIRYARQGANLTAVARDSALGEERYRHLYLDYDLSGNIVSTEGPSRSCLVDFDYDKLGRPIHVQSTQYSAAIPESGYDAAGNLTACRVTDSLGDTLSVFEYDGLDQLVEEQGVAQRSYRFDSLFNRIGYTVNALNQVLDDGRCQYSYDLNGNLIAKQEGGHITEYRYDALDRLASVGLNGGKTIGYTYDGFNRRLSRSCSDGSSVRYLYDGSTEIGTVNETGMINQLRILGDSKSVAIELGDEVFVPVHSLRGDIVALVDLDGQVVEAYRYSAFGEEISGSGRCPWLYSGKRIDEDTKLVAFGRRDYDPVLGRWMTRDPAGFIDSYNLYQYLLNNPFRYSDPDGQFVIPILITLFEFGLPTLTLALPTITTLTELAITAAISYSLYELADALNKGNHRAISMASELAIPENDAVEVTEAEDKDQEPPYDGRKLGNDPTKCPGEGFVWKGDGPPGRGEGSWYNSSTKESLYPDLNHPPGKAPHWDYKIKSSPKGQRLFLDGTWEFK